MPRGTYEPEVVVETGNLTEEEWLDYRRGGIGGSDVSIIFGVSHFRCNRELYYDKLGIKPLRDAEDETWLQKEMGHVLEDLVAKVFSRKTGLKAFEVKKMFSHPLYPFMRADVDRFVIDENGRTGILECKTTNYQNKDAWAGEKYPYQYELQIRHYMAVMNLDFAYIACLWGNSENDFAYRYVERDLEFEDEIIEAEQYFWEEYIEKRVEPEFAGKPDLALQCLKMYLEDANPSLGKKTLPASMGSDLARYLELKEEKSKLDADVRRLDDEIKRISIPIIEEMGAFTESELSASGRKFLVTYKPRKSVRILTKALEKMAIHHRDERMKMIEDYAIINEGYAKKNQFGFKDLVPSKKIKEYSQYGDNLYIDDMIYINALGDVLLDCDMSYQTQKKHVLGNVLNESLEDILIRNLADSEMEVVYG